MKGEDGGRVDLTRDLTRLPSKAQMASGQESHWLIEMEGEDGRRLDGGSGWKERMEGGWMEGVDGGRGWKEVGWRELMEGEDGRRLDGGS